MQAVRVVKQIVNEKIFNYNLVRTAVNIDIRTHEKWHFWHHIKKFN